MIVLGLNAFAKNPSACLIRDGALTAFCQEERFTRLKGSYGLFPSHTVSWCLKSEGITLQDVNKIAVSWGCQKFPGGMIKHLVKVKMGLIGKNPFIYESSIGEKRNLWSSWEYIHLYSPRTFKTKVRDYLRSFGHKGPIPSIEFVDHHLSHAYQTYFQSAFQDAIVLVADGSGEENCVSGFAVKNGSFRKILGFDVPQSLGWFFGGFTAYLGFHPNRDEGKMMGLAALGQSRRNENPWFERLDKIVRVTPEGYELDPLYFKFGGNEFHPRFTDHLVKYITSHDPDLTPIGIDECSRKDGRRINRYLLDSYIDLAYAVQCRLEHIMQTLVKRLVRETNIKNLCLAGGISMNCKVNGFILDGTGIENIFVHPASSDDGACVGAGFLIAKESGDDPRNILKHVQLGPSFTNDDVESIIRHCNLTYKKPNDICTATAKFLASDKVLGWFHGGVEMGARALGGRSIIACAQNPNIKERISKKIKFREIWRPYSPSLTSESKGIYLQAPIETPFMIISRKANSKLSNNAPTVIHVDGSVRPQTVEKDVLPRWHGLLDNMEEYTGDPLVLNTSLNVRGEPIACNPYDAIRCLFSTDLDGLVMEDCLILK